MIRGIGNVPCSTCSQTYNGQGPRVSFGEPLVNVITLRGPCLVSGTGDDPLLLSPPCVPAPRPHG